MTTPTLEPTTGCDPTGTYDPPADRLHGAIMERGPIAYLLTVGDDGRPHCTAQAFAWAGDALTTAPGPRSAANLIRRPGVSVLWPPSTWGEPSLIVDAVAELESGAGPASGRVRLHLTRAVWHPTPNAGGDPTGEVCQAL